MSDANSRSFLAGGDSPYLDYDGKDLGDERDYDFGEGEEGEEHDYEWLDEEDAGEEKVTVVGEEDPRAEEEKKEEEEEGEVAVDEKDGEVKSGTIGASAGLEKRCEKDGKSRKKVTIVEDAEVFEESKPLTSKSIYQLEAYASLKMARESVKVKAEETVEEAAPEDDIRFSKTLGIPGLARLSLTPLTQKIVGCTIDENVTTEYPWIYVRKEIIEDNLDLHSESSDFLPVKDEIVRYREPRMLLGYAPTGDEDEGQFYICLTEEGHAGVARRIQALRREQEDRVRNAVHKEPAGWLALGSAEEVDRATVRTSRPLYEVQIESRLNKIKSSSQLVDRTADDQRDGYVEITPYRQTFTNITRLLVDKAANAIPITKEDEAQTATVLKVNSLCQCRLNEESSAEAPPVQPKIIDQFLKSHEEEVCRQIFTNTTWDMYANDYVNLAASTTPITTARCVVHAEWKSYFDGKLCQDRVINDLTWHPEWTGVMAAAYTTLSKSENLIGTKPPNYKLDEVNQVLLWSFDDCLKPKLLLESQRQVSAVSFCPHNGNIVIGGCINGQIKMWDISGRIESVEKVIVRTAAQAKYETIMKSLSPWMKEWRGSEILRSTISSSLQFSQTGAITKIEWMSPYHKMDDRGRIHDLPADTEKTDLSLQFLTSSEDGSIAVWDLNWRPSAKKDDMQPKKKKAIEKPATLTQSISSFKVLDKIFKPIYMLVIQTPNETRISVITEFSLHSEKLRKVQVQPIPRVDNVVARKYYKSIFEKPERRKSKEDEEKDKKEEEMTRNGDPDKKKEELVSVKIFVCTSKGECGLITWEGFDFSTGSSVNQEICKWAWSKQMHDGPISHVARSRYLDDVLVTVGGRVFAVWREDFAHPIFWRRSEYRYTACCWDNSKPSVIVLGRNDGTVEIWDVCIKSHEPTSKQSLSGRIITGIYAHELPLHPQCVGFCDFNGALRIFLAPKELSELRQSDVDWMRQFIDREVDRIQDFLNWKQEWHALNTDDVAEEKPSEEEAKRQAALMEEKQRNDAAAEEAAKIEAARRAKARARKNLIERMRARWVTRELGRMQQFVLEGKGLRDDDLERRQEPVKRMEREAREKAARRKRIFEGADELFEEAVSANFPHQRQTLLRSLALPSGRGEQRYQSVDQTAIGDHKTLDDRIMEEFEAIEEQALSKMRRTSRDLDFSWRNLISEGKKRRRSMDIKLTAHKINVDRLSYARLSDLSSLRSFEDEDATREEDGAKTEPND